MIGLHVEIFRHKKNLYLNVFSWGLLLNNGEKKKSSTKQSSSLRCQTFSFSFFPCSADHERDWPPCKVVFFGLATNALNVRNNNNN